MVTADFDFTPLVDSRGTPPKIIRLEKMDYSTEVAADLSRVVRERNCSARAELQQQGDEDGAGNNSKPV